MKQRKKTSLIVITGLLAALVFVITRLSVPSINNRIIHFGDAVIYLAASILPVRYAVFASAIGAGLSDALTPGCVQWIIPTIIIKSLMALCFRRSENKIICSRNIISSILAGVICMVGYYIAEGIIDGNFLIPLSGIPSSLIQSSGSEVLFILVGLSFDKMKLKNYFKKQLEGES